MGYQCDSDVIFIPWYERNRRINHYDLRNPTCTANSRRSGPLQGYVKISVKKCCVTFIDSAVFRPVPIHDVALQRVDGERTVLEV